MDLINSQSKVTPKDLFLYLGMMVALYVSVGSLLKLLFDIINTVYPDALSGSYYYDPYSTAMRLAIASLIIVFPIYLWISYYLSKQVRRDESKKNIHIPMQGEIDSMNVSVAAGILLFEVKKQRNFN